MSTTNSVVGMCGAEKSAFDGGDGSSKKELVCQSWSFWAQENCININDKAKCEEDFTSLSTNKDSTNSTLHHSKAPLYGICPAQDEFLTVKCKQCSILLKPVAHRAHMNYRHNVLLKSPDIAGQFAWSCVISPPPPPCESTSVNKSGCTATASSSLSANSSLDINVLPNVATAQLPKVELVESSSSSNLFEKFGVMNGDSSKSSGRSTVKLKKPKPPPIKTTMPNAPNRATTLPIAKDKMLTKIEDYVVTQKSDHRLKITISKKALKEPDTVNTSKWTIPKVGLVAKKEPLRSKSTRYTSIKRNGEQPSITKFEQIDVKEYIDYCLPTTASMNDGIDSTGRYISALNDHYPSDVPCLINVDDNCLSQKVQYPSRSFNKTIIKQNQRRLSCDRNNNATHPKPVAVCSYGSRRFGAKSFFVLNRKNDMIREAFEAALDENYGNNSKLMSTSTNSINRRNSIPAVGEPAKFGCSNGLVVTTETLNEQKASEQINNVTVTTNGGTGSWCKMTSQNGTARPLTVSVVPQDLLTQLLNSNNGVSAGNYANSVSHNVINSNLVNGNVSAATNQRDKQQHSTTYTTINLNHLTLNSNSSHVGGGNLVEKTKFTSEYGSVNSANVGCFATVGRAASAAINNNNITAKRNSRKREAANTNTTVYGARCGAGGGVKRARNANLDIGPYSTAMNRDNLVIHRNKLTHAVGPFSAKNLLHHTPSVRPISSSVPSNVVQRLLQSNAQTSGTSTATVLTLPSNAVILDGNKIYTVQNGPSGPHLVESGVTDGASLQNVLNASGDCSSSSASVSVSSTPSLARAIQPKIVSSDLLQQTSGNGNSAFLVQNTKIQNGLISVNQTHQQQHSTNQFRPNLYPHTVVVCTGNVDAMSNNNSGGSTVNHTIQPHQQQPWVVNLRSQTGFKGNGTNQSNCRPLQSNSTGALPLVRFTVNNNAPSSSSSSSAVTVVSGLRTSVTAPVLVRANVGVQHNNSSVNQSNMINATSKYFLH